MKATITYIGETGSNVWGGVDLLPAVTFEKNKPVTIDTDTVPGNEKGFYAHLIKKARTNRFFEVADVKSKDASAKDTKDDEPKKKARTRPSKSN